MPPLIGAVVAIAGSVIGSAIGLAGIGLTLFSMAFQGLAMMIMGGQSKQDKPPQSGLQQTVRSSTEARRIVYGEARTSGPLVYASTVYSVAVNGALELVVPLAGHRCFYIGDIFLDDRPLDPRSSDGWVRTGPWVSPSTSTPLNVRCETALGTLTQAALADLSAEDSNWDATHRGAGVAYVWVHLQYRPAVFPTGIPNVSAVVKGRMVYDPRNPGPSITSSSAGTPGVFNTGAAHGFSPGDPVWIIGHTAVGTESFPSLGTKIAKEYEVHTVPGSTQFTLLGPDGNPLAITTGGTGGTVTKLGWTNNWALCVRDWLASLFGLGADDTTEINDTLIIAAANTSDEMVALAQLVQIFTASTGADQLTLGDPSLPEGAVVSEEVINTGDQVTLSTTGTLPAPLAVNTKYWVIRTGTDPTLPTTLQLATSLTNALSGPPVPINITTVGTGTHTLTKSFQRQFTADHTTGRLQLSDDTMYFATGDQVVLDNQGGALPTGLSASTTYYWISQGSKNIRLAGTQTVVVGGIPTVLPEEFALYGLLATSLANARAGIAVAFTDNGTGTQNITKTAQPRYTCDGIIKRDSTRINILDDLLTGGAGALIYTAGQYNLFAAVAGTPTLTLNESWLASGDIVLQTALERAQLFNAVRGTFVDPSRFWADNDMPPLVNPTYEAQDGGERIYKDLNFPFTQDGTRCQRIGNIYLQKSRAGQTFSAHCNFNALQLAGWDVVTVDLAKFGINGPFRVLGWKPSLDPGNNLGVDVVLQEESSSAYSWTQGQAQTINASADVVLPTPWVAQPPTSLALESDNSTVEVAGDGTVHPRILVTWTAPADAFVITAGRVELQFKKATDANWSPSVFVSGDIDPPQAYLSPVVDGVAYDVQIRSVNQLNAQSDWVQGTVTAVGKTTPPTDVPSLVVAQNGALVVLTAAPIPDTDTAVFEFRYGAVGSPWESLQLIEPVAARPIAGLYGASLTTAAIPTGTWSFAVKAKDTSGNYSVDATFQTASVTSSASVISGVAQAPDWLGLGAGSSSGFLKHYLGYLVPDSTKAADLHTLAELFTEFVPYPVATAIYEAPEIDIGFDDTVKLFSSPLTIMAGAGVSGSPAVKTQLDSWLSAGVDSGVFSDFPGGQVKARYFRDRLVHTPGSTPGYVTAWTPTLTKDPVPLAGTVVCAPGGSPVSFSQPYHTTPQILMTPSGANVAWHTGESGSGFTAHVGPDSTHDNGGTTDWAATGV